MSHHNGHQVVDAEFDRVVSVCLFQAIEAARNAAHEGNLSLRAERHHVRDMLAHNPDITVERAFVDAASEVGPDWHVFVGFPDGKEVLILREP